MRGRRAALLAAVGGGLAAVALSVAPTPAAKVARVGAMLTTNPRAAAHILAGFKERLSELGWSEGRNLTLELRWAEGKAERFPAMAAEMLRLNVDVLLASSTPAAEAARDATKTTPIVMVNASDPVSRRLVASLARPGGNVTGLTSQVTPDIRAKQLQLLKEAFPRVARVAVLRSPGQIQDAIWKDYQAAAQVVGVKVQAVDVRAAEDIDRVFALLAQDRPGAVLVPAGAGDPLFFINRERVVARVTEQRLPAMFGLREFTDAGGLMSYSAELSDQFRRAAGYVDKILKGARPGDLPVEHPTRFELVVNLKAARALGVALPQSLLLRADHVIQ
jgi:putative ABC transport system substrate-binding protein